jgi:hypothetical protein
MQNTTWGRKESIVWPYQIPIYAYSTAFFSAVLTFFFVCGWIRFGATPLQRYYLPLYERTSVIGAFSKTHRSNYSLLFVAGHRLSNQAAKPFRSNSRQTLRSMDTRSFSVVRCAAFPTFV